MRKFIFSILLFSCLSVQAQLAFEKIIGISSQNYGACIIETSDHAIIYCGSFYSAGQSIMIVGKLDWAGNEIWEIIDTVFGEPWGLIQLPDSNLVIGYNSGDHIVVQKVSANGDSLTSISYGGSGWDPLDVRGNSLDASETGTIFLSAREEGNDYWGEYYAGGVFWLMNSSLNIIHGSVPSDFICSSSSIGSPSEVKCGTANKFYYGNNLTGFTCAPQGNLGVMNINGDSIWLRNLFIRFMTSVDPLDDGGCYATSEYYTDSTYLGKYDASGNLLWENSMSHISSPKVLSTSEDGVLLGQEGIILKRYDELGNPLWSHQFGSGYDEIQLNNLKRTSDDTYLGIGTAHNFNTDEYFIYIFRTVSDEILSTENIDSYKPKFELFPNPATEFVSVFLKQLPPTDDLDLSLTDLTGKLVKRITLNGKSIKIDLSNFSEGAYLIQLSTKGKILGSRLLIKVSD